MGIPIIPWDEIDGALSELEKLCLVLGSVQSTLGQLPDGAPKRELAAKIRTSLMCAENIVVYLGDSKGKLSRFTG